MNTRPSHVVGAVLASLIAAAPLCSQGTAADYRRALGLRKQVRGKTFNTELQPHWFGAEDRYLWYRREIRNQRSFVLVDCTTGERGPAFDHVKVAAALAKASKRKVEADRLPFRSIAFDDSRGKLVFRAFRYDWQVDLDSFAVLRLGKAPPVPRSKPAGRRNRRNRPNRRVSPDGQWRLTIVDHDLILGPADGGEDVALTKDGTAAGAYEAPSWSPDGKRVVFFRTRPGGVKKVPLIDSSPREQLVAKFELRNYARPGDPFPVRRMLILDMATRRTQAVAVAPLDFRGPPRLRWNKAGTKFTFERTDRGHKRFRVVEVDAKTGEARTVVDERTQEYKAGDTFINGWGFTRRYLTNSRGFLYTSERDGWKHLYRVDLATTSRRQLTRGPWVVRAIEHVDEDRREIWFNASGRVTGQDPYFLHHYRVDFDGGNLVALTAGDGDHSVQHSPGRRYLVDTYSRVDRAPRHALRDARSGKLICELETADVADLLKTGWRWPEPFVAKGRDGKTDIWGVIYRPGGFDAKRRYPVIESIYAGPHGSFVPKRFAAHRGPQALAELGFVVVQIDGMGTNNRSKAFHDVCWQNVGDAGLPDRISWLKAAAARYAWMDLERVGIYGTSAGGQSSTGALLFHPEFYKVAVSACGCHDNRLDKASWNEQWMGHPVAEHYAAQSNVTNAYRLRGKLFLIVGELDKNVPPESTMRLVDALIRADKDFDLLVIPGAGHTSGGDYGRRRRWDYFVRNLLGCEPRR